MSQVFRVCAFVFLGLFSIRVVLDLLWADGIAWVENSMHALFLAVFMLISFGVRALIRKMDKKYETIYEKKKGSP
ncbi:hypothetical protein IMZ31_05140 [Pontibacillus sp. ALD_SL1]|uniref:hypothetical protein n=1 Tax=Pontibacillus sp. ALD_SL1 TaxID=2777185 RepID=UPI001A9698B9|nr:hypothetical protein [Pontibacillus sp. ALD_SL1]QST00958.1 hypothetical protein IMZ31_05140 [Pontibacillus sp. ALD_SL1]